MHWIKYYHHWCIVEVYTFNIGLDLFTLSGVFKIELLITTNKSMLK